MARKQWKDMSREELIAEKGLWESKLQSVNQRLKQARRKAAADKVFLTAQELDDLESERLKCAGTLRGVQCQLTAVNAKAKTLNKRRSFEEFFEEVAYRLLAEDQYDEVAAEAQDLYDNQGEN